MFAQMDALMNSRVVEFLADKVAYRLSGPSGAIVGEAIPVIFSEPNASAFNGMIAGSKPTITLEASNVFALGDPLSVDAKAYLVDEIIPSNGLNLIVLAAV